jgi:hypothetical protein
MALIKPEQIPDEVVEAATKAFDASEEDAYVSHAHDIRVAIAAAINAWPGMVIYPPDVLDSTINPERIILPLPMEQRDE